MTDKLSIVLTLLLLIASTSVLSCPENCISCTVRNQCTQCFKSDLTFQHQCVPPSVPNCLLSAYNLATKHYSCVWCAKGYAGKHLGTRITGDNTCVQTTKTIESCINNVFVASQQKCFTCSGRLAPSKSFDSCETPERQFANCVAYSRRNDNLMLSCSRCGPGYTLDVERARCIQSPTQGCLNAYVSNGGTRCVTCDGFEGYYMRRSDGSCSK